MTDQEALFGAIEKNGNSNQIIIAIEECGELIQGLTKHMRSDSLTDYDNIAEEMADVKIAIRQLELIYKNTQKVDTWYRLKMDRIKSKL